MASLTEKEYMEILAERERVAIEQFNALPKVNLRDYLAYVEDEEFSEDFLTADDFPYDDD